MQKPEQRPQGTNRQPDRPAALPRTGLHHERGHLNSRQATQIKFAINLTTGDKAAHRVDVSPCCARGQTPFPEQVVAVALQQHLCRCQHRHRHRPHHPKATQIPQQRPQRLDRAVIRVPSRATRSYCQMLWMERSLVFRRRTPRRCSGRSGRWGCRSSPGVVRR